MTRPLTPLRIYLWRAPRLLALLAFSLLILTAGLVTLAPRAVRVVAVAVLLGAVFVLALARA